MTIVNQNRCVVCGEPAGSYAIAVDEYLIYKCAQCGLEYTLPIPTLHQLKDFYASYTDVRAENNVVRENSIRQLKILSDIGLAKEDLILDFGSGAGMFIEVAGDNCYGVEFRAASQRVYSSTKDLPERKFKYITMWGVLEHLTNPVEIIAELQELLTSEGRIILTTVNAEGLIPYYYKPIEHLTYWTQTSFHRLFESCGMNVVSFAPYYMLQHKDVYLNRLLSRTPEHYQEAFQCTLTNLPNYVEVPTNEILVVAEKILK